MKTIAIILLNYNSTGYTKTCIKSLLSSKDADHEYSIVVWDNGSTKVPSQHDFPNAAFFASRANDGFAGGNNKAIAYALTLCKPDYILMLNNDTRVTKGFLKEMIVAFESDPTIGCVVPKIYFEKGHEFHRKKYSVGERGKVIWYGGGGIDWDNVIPFHIHVDEVDRGHVEKEEETVFATGCCLLTKTEIWKKLHGFDTKYFLYYEDTDLSIRLKKIGSKILFVPQAKIYHINAGSSDGSGSQLHLYYQTRNRLRFGLQYAGMRAKIALMKEAYHVWKTGNAVQRLAVAHAMEGKWGKQEIKIQDK